MTTSREDSWIRSDKEWLDAMRRLDEREKLLSLMMAGHDHEPSSREKWDIWSLAYHMMSGPISRRKDGWTGVTRASVFVTKSKESGELWPSVKIERGDQHRNYDL